MSNSQTASLLYFTFWRWIAMDMMNGDRIFIKYFRGMSRSAYQLRKNCTQTIWTSVVLEFSSYFILYTYRAVHEKAHYIFLMVRPQDEPADASHVDLLIWKPSKRTNNVKILSKSLIYSFWPNFENWKIWTSVLFVIFDGQSEKHTQ
mgnify:CR=1 FL=1